MRTTTGPGGPDQTTRRPARRPVRTSPHGRSTEPSRLAAAPRVHPRISRIDMPPSAPYNVPHAAALRLSKPFIQPLASIARRTDLLGESR